MGWDEVKRARLRLSREQGAIVKDWGGRIPIALIYPNSYYLGMSNLAVHTIYSLLNSYSGIVCERVFWERDNWSSGRLVLSLESQRPLRDFAVLAFSISYELDYLNLTQILRANGIPLQATERNRSHPLIIAGGPCITANPLPLSPFFDCLCIGEAEAILPAMLPILSVNMVESRHDLIKALALLPGCYVPLAHSGNAVARQWVGDLNDFPVTSVILTPDTELGELFLIEVERGCSWGCRFCLVSHTFNPIRYRSVDKLVAQAQEGFKYRKRLGLVGAAVADYPQIEDLVVRLRQMGAELSISSLRMSPLSPVLLREMVRSGVRTIALAPEAGSERLRRIIKKGVSEDSILRAMANVAEQKIKQLKLYFMIGLPSETDEDIEEIIKLTLDCQSILDRQNANCRMVLNVTPFIPKAGTPFQWLPMERLQILNRRLSLLKKRLSPRGIKIKCESMAWSQVQAVFARGDANLAGVLASLDEASLSGWRRAVAKCHLDVAFYAHQIWTTSQRLPWEVVDLGIDAGYLESELKKAMAQFKLS
ncbi:radical SAM protein [Chloroflexota bacterium]